MSLNPFGKINPSVSINTPSANTGEQNRNIDGYNESNIVLIYIFVPEKVV